MKQSFGVLYMVSPFLMALAKLAGWDPFSNMPWVWITSPWWYVMFVVFTTKLVQQTWERQEVSPSGDKSEIRKDLH